jgi:hypothetical protein
MLAYKATITDVVEPACVYASGFRVRREMCRNPQS